MYLEVILIINQRLWINKSIANSSANIHGKKAIRKLPVVFIISPSFLLAKKVKVLNLKIKNTIRKITNIAEKIKLIKQKSADTLFLVFKKIKGTTTNAKDKPETMKTIILIILKLICKLELGCCGLLNHLI
ncbi:hypothetical protein [Spiroplasma endosymbiont of Amphimallon solstitiale]|uniref:hypothetical protein n=1 Tax=Spiroplasma endosymbiont of Amphimallon solstitiale TaxID=3066288 RepID=UPI00313E5F89